MFNFRLEIDENTSLQQSLDKSFDNLARNKRDFETTRQDAQKLVSELETLKVIFNYILASALVRPL